MEDTVKEQRNRERGMKDDISERKKSMTIGEIQVRC